MKRFSVSLNIFSIILAIIVCVCCIFLLGQYSYASDPSSDVSKVESVDVFGIHTYKHCLNECGIEHNHYIEFAEVIIMNDCITDGECATCLDICAAELEKNNPTVYKSTLEQNINLNF